MTNKVPQNMVFKRITFIIVTGFIQKIQLLKYDNIRMV